MIGASIYGIVIARPITKRVQRNVLWKKKRPPLVVIEKKEPWKAIVPVETTAVVQVKKCLYAKKEEVKDEIITPIEPIKEEDKLVNRRQYYL